MIQIILIFDILPAITHSRWPISATPELGVGTPAPFQLKGSWGHPEKKEIYDFTFNPNSTGLLATCNTPGGIQRHATEIILPDGILTNGKKHCVGMKK